LKKEELNDLGLLKEILMNKEEHEKLSRQFFSYCISFLDEHKHDWFPLRGIPKTLALSTTFGSYEATQQALYVSKNEKNKHKLKKTNLRDFYHMIEKIVFSLEGNRIMWRSNLLIDAKTKEVLEVEFIPMAYKGGFLLDVLMESDVPIADFGFLFILSINKTGKIIHDAIAQVGYSSTYPRTLKKEEIESKEFIKNLKREVDEVDFHIESRFIGKSIFLAYEKKLIDKFSESGLEIPIGLGLVKEGIPFLIQYEITESFPLKSSKLQLITAADFFIVGQNPIAIFCDSYRYHVKKRKAFIKDRRIDRKLQKMGITVLRFAEEEINNNLEGCVEEIKETFLGKPFALSPIESLTNKIKMIPFDKLSNWERLFLESLENKILKGSKVSLKEEKILNDILKKFGN